jgi:hypothetical protein
MENDAASLTGLTHSVKVVYVGFIKIEFETLEGAPIAMDQGADGSSLV